MSGDQPCMPFVSDFNGPELDSGGAGWQGWLVKP